MSPLATITLITLLLTASTVLITFVSRIISCNFSSHPLRHKFPFQCIYSQGRSNHTWLVQKTEELGLMNPTQVGVGYASFADPFAAAGHYELALKSQTIPDTKTLVQLSHIYTDSLLLPNATVALLQPYLQPQSDGSNTGTEASYQTETTNLSSGFRSDLQLSCAYLQALVLLPSHSQQMLQYLEALRSENVSFDACIYYAQHQVLIARMYYADAYQTSVEFVRAYPTLYQAHTAMGDALLYLQRTNEASAVLRVAHSLVDAMEVQTALSAPMVSRNATLDPLLRLGGALYACDAMTEAESVYTLVVGLLQSSELAEHCALLSRLAQVHQKRGSYTKAYVVSLQCVKYCPRFWEGYLHLGTLTLRLNRITINLTILSFIHHFLSRKRTTSSGLVARCLHQPASRRTKQSVEERSQGATEGCESHRRRTTKETGQRGRRKARPPTTVGSKHQATRAHGFVH